MDQEWQQCNDTYDKINSDILVSRCPGDYKITQKSRYANCTDTGY